TGISRTTSGSTPRTNALPCAGPSERSRSTRRFCTGSGASVADTLEAPGLGGLRSALGRPPVWLVVWCVEALLALAPAMLLHGWMKGAISHRYEPGSLFGNLDTYFRFDHLRESETLDGAMGMLGGVLAILAVLFGAFAAGGWLQVFLERTHGHSLQRFFLGGARYFWRFFRLALGTVLALSLWTW